MDKSNVVNQFTNYVDQLRTQECSQKEKINCFQHIAECILSPAMSSHINYETHCSNATSVLLLFCEDLDSVVRMSAEENLNRIFRWLERNRVRRIPMDLYGEIKKNGNQRSLRICLNLFAYYAPRIKEKHVSSYSTLLLPHLKIIAKRKETQLCETLCEFIKAFSQHMQMGMDDSEICKLLDVFIDNIGSECAIKRRCSSQNCISLIENARNRSLMAKHALNRAYDLLLKNGHQNTNILLGTLGFLRILLPLIIREENRPARVHRTSTSTPNLGRTTNNNTNSKTNDNIIVLEVLEIIEIYDFCIHLLDTNHTSNHSIINASLEVINSIVQSLDGTGTDTETEISAIGRAIEHLLCNHQLKHNDLLRKGKSLKSQILESKNIQMPSTTISSAIAAEQRRCWTSAAMWQARNTKNGASLQSRVGGDADGGKVPTAASGLNKHKKTTTTTTTMAGASKGKSVEDETESISEAFKLGIERAALEGVSAEHPTPPPRRHHQYHPTARTTITSSAVLDKSGISQSVDEVATSGCTTTITTTTGNDELQLKNHKDDQHHRRIIDDDDDDDDDGFTTLLEVNEPLQDDSHLSLSTESLPQARKQTVEALPTTVTVDVNLLIEDEVVDEGGDSAIDGDGGGSYDDKSQFLSDIDNESFNSIDFESEITIGGADGGSATTENDNNNSDSKDAESTSRAILSSLTGGAVAGSKRTTLTTTTTSSSSVSSMMTTSVNSGSGKSSDTIGSFFNNLLSHSSAESMTKLFRSAPKPPSLPIPDTTQVPAVINSTASSPQQQQQQQHEDADNLSLESINSHISLCSHVSLPTNSSSSRNEQDLVMVAHQSSGSATATTATATGEADDDALSSASATASTALLVDNTNTRNTSDVSDDDNNDDDNGEELVPVTKSQHHDAMDGNARQTIQVNIGTIYDQAIIYYTSRLIVAKFLLTGHRGHLHSDSSVRVSIKHLSLNIVANCTRLMPEVLRIPLEISASEIRRSHLALQIPEEDEQLTIGHCSNNSNNSSDSTSSSSNVGKDFDHLTDECRKQPRIFPELNQVVTTNFLPLEIKDDHFGESTTNAYLNQPLSRSADPKLLFAELGKQSPQTQQQPVPSPKRNYKRSEQILSKSEIIESKTSRATTQPIVAKAVDAAQPITSQLRDISIGGKSAVEKFNLANKQASSLLSSNDSVVSGAGNGLRVDQIVPEQPECPIVSDVLFFYNHSDPILRGDVQIIIGNFLQSTLGCYHNRNELFGGGGGTPSSAAVGGGMSNADDYGNCEFSCAARSHLEINRLLAILIKGLQDDIHTVVIHALNAFDKIFPLLMSKYLTASYKQQQNRSPHHHSSPDASNDDEEKDSHATRTSNGSNRSHYNDHLLYADDTLIENLLKCFESNNPIRHDQHTLALTRTTATSSAYVRIDCCGTSDGDGGPLNNIEKQPTHAHHHAAGRAGAPAFFIISPKLLLSKLRLCYHNKYWLVLNKYSEVISNLDYDAIREYYGNDLASTYEDTFLDELLQLVGDDDFRVREHAADCLCRFIIQISRGHQQRQYRASTNQMPSVTTTTSSQTTGRHDTTMPSPSSSSLSNKLDRTNFNLLWDFYDYRVFQNMSMPIRDLFVERSPAEPLANAKVLAKVLYRLTNKLMELNDRNLQLGIIYAVKVLLKAFNFFDFREVWMEFNFAEICSKFAYYNYATALDLNCQNDLMEVTTALMAGNVLTTNVISHNRFIDNLLAHTMKIINIYFHLCTNRKPVLFAKAPRNDLFANNKGVNVLNSMGYFGSDHTYIKLYDILESAHNSYKMTISDMSGAKLMSLLRTCINTLSTCIELRMNCGDPSPSGNPIRFIEEVIRYLSKLINFAPTECIGSLRQLLKFLFRRNYGSRSSEYLRFISPYLAAKLSWGCGCGGNSGDDSAMTIPTGGSPKHLAAATAASNNSSAIVGGSGGDDGGSEATRSQKQIPTAGIDSTMVFGELFTAGLEFPLWKADWENDYAKHIKMFERLVIYCLKMFMKSNGLIQASVLDLLSDLLELNVTYSILDSSGMILDEILYDLDLIESGVARNSNVIIPAAVKFLVQLTYKSDQKTVTIPKIISIANNLLANNSIRECSVLALKGLAFEVFFMPTTISGTMVATIRHHRPAPPLPFGATTSPPPPPPPPPLRLNIADDGSSASALDAKELDTQKEVILGMLEKFIDSPECQRMLAILLLQDRGCRTMVAFEQQIKSKVTGKEEQEKQSSPLPLPLPSPTTSPIQDGAIYSIVTKALCDGRVNVHDWQRFFVLESLFQNSGKNILSDSKEFSSMLSLFITKDVKSFSDLSCVTIILENVILKTEEIYLVNHIKLYLKNHLDSGMGLEATPIAGAATKTTSRGGGASHPQSGVGYTMSDADYTGRQSTNMSSSPSTSRAATSSATFSPNTPNNRNVNEINYFAKVLCEKLDGCLATLTKCRTPPNRKYCGLVVRFVRALYAITKMKDSLQPAVCRILVDEYNFWDRYNLGGLSVDEGLQMEMLKLFVAIKLSSDRTWVLQQIQEDGIKWNVQRTLLRQICLRLEQDLPTPNSWDYCEIQQLFSRNFLNILINDNLSTVRLLCEGNEEYCSLFLRALIENCDALEKNAIRRLVVQFIERLENNRMQCIDAKVELLTSLFDLVDDYGNKSLENVIVRASRRIIAEHDDKSAVRNNFLISCSAKLKRKLFGAELDAVTDEAISRRLEQKIIDEKWLFAQATNLMRMDFSSANAEKLARILLEVTSEFKLTKIFTSPDFDAEHVLPASIDLSLKTMMSSFRNNCIQHNPHIHYMNVNPLARVAISNLMTRIDEYQFPNVQQTTDSPLYLASAMISLMENLKHIEELALIYIESKFIDKFVKEHLLRPEHLPILKKCLQICCLEIEQSLMSPTFSMGALEMHTYSHCIDMMLKHKLIWFELNLASDDGGDSSNDARLLNNIVNMLFVAITESMGNTIFYKKYKSQLLVPSAHTMPVFQKAIFIAKLIETSPDVDDSLRGSPIKSSTIPMRILKSIGISILRINRFYAYAVTPLEIYYPSGPGYGGGLGGGGGGDGGGSFGAASDYESQIKSSNGKLPSIPVEHLSDVDVLQKFVKRLSIFGFTTRQQFEEYFMTFLLLINEVYDENMVDVQEQFQIKSVCLEAILELLITYKTFPIVGSKLSYFHHTTRWSRINCDSISLKKLHKVQLLVSDSNIFYHPNLERNLSASAEIAGGVGSNVKDNVIGTLDFRPNQYDLNFIWQQMEVYNNPSSPSRRSSGSSGGGDASTITTSGDGATKMPGGSILITAADGKEDVFARNYRHFTESSGIDFRSSSQFIFDVLMQINEHNHILALPNLVKFCEICDSRDQIKLIRDKALRLQETIPMDDTITHQYVIYLLCKTQAMLIPTPNELSHLCTLAGVYLKSSHVFIRNATLCGLLCLLECCSKTNTTIGKLSEELSMLRDLIIGYIVRHRIVEESPSILSDTHMKLIWTLNFSLIEWTSKFVTQCHLLSNTVIWANKFLKRTTNEDIYLCVIHGLERIIVINAATPEMRGKIEKLALDLMKLENERFSIPALKLLLSCMYMSSSKQLENTELSNGIVQDDPEIIAQQTDKVDILLHCIKSSTRRAAWIYGQVLCQIIRDLVPPNEILTKVIKEFLAINQPHCDVIASIVHQVFRSAIDSSFLQMLQDWLICSLPTFLTLPQQKGVWALTVIFLSASINLHLIKLFPVALVEFHELGQQEITLFQASAQDFHSKLSGEQKIRFRDAFKRFHQNEIFARMLHSL